MQMDSTAASSGAQTDFTLMQVVSWDLFSKRDAVVAAIPARRKRKSKRKAQKRSQSELQQGQQTSAKLTYCDYSYYYVNVIEMCQPESNRVHGYATC